MSMDMIIGQENEKKIEGKRHQQREKYNPCLCLDFLNENEGKKHPYAAKERERHVHEQRTRNLFLLK